jgi:O-succinylhomoserine sulfhydrylase
MSAVFNALAATLDAGDRVVAARGLFGSCYQVLAGILPRWDIHTDFVDGDDLDQWERALSTPAKAVFFETPSNPMQELVDIRRRERAGARRRARGSSSTTSSRRRCCSGRWSSVPTWSCTRRPSTSTGRAGRWAAHPRAEGIRAGGAAPLMRHTGPTMSPFNAWVVLKSLETLRLRMEHQTATALGLATLARGAPAGRLGPLPDAALAPAARPGDGPDVAAAGPS